MSTRLYLYPIWIRIWHLLNLLLCLGLIFTGVSMQYSDPEYPLMRFDLAVSMHNICGVALSISYVFFIVGNLFTGNGRFYKSWLEDLKKNMVKQFKYYTLGIFKKEKAPFPINEKRKFNPMQKVSYVFVMYLFVPLLTISGWALLFPEMIPNMLGISGVYITDLFHVISGFVVSVFMFVHIYFCTIGTTPGSNFKSMITGWHE